MSRKIHSLALIGVAFAGSTVLALAQPMGKEKSAPVDPAFAKMKSLVGEWVNAEAQGEDAKKVAVAYQVVSNGSAVLETMKEKYEDGMITVYHMDGEQLMLTHYCGLGNQPHMRAGPLSGNKLSFKCAGGTNMKSEKDLHMHALTIMFTDADHMTAAWTLSENGKAKDEHVFHYARKK